MFSIVSGKQAKELTPLIPSLLGLLTLGAATFLPLVWLRPRRGKIFVAIEVWDQNHGALEGARVQAQNPTAGSSTASAGCWAGEFVRELSQILACVDIPHESPLGRLRLIETLLESLPVLLSRLVLARPHRPCPCAYCRIALQDIETQQRLRRFLERHQTIRSIFGEAARMYGFWLQSECLQDLQQTMGKGGPLTFVGFLRPHLAPAVVT
jgi:hypothetical protein